MISNAAERLSARIRPFAAAGLVFVVGASPAFAHHPFEGVPADQLTLLQGLFSGLGHPLLGVDHVLFLVAIAFLALRRPGRWMLPLLSVGLAGSLVSQLVPLAPSLTGVIESSVSLSLVAEGLIGFGLLPQSLLLPLIGLHGYMLGTTIVGAEPTPLLAYGFGLLISQGLLLLAATTLSERVSNLLGDKGRQLAACVLIGVGSALTWSAIAG